VVDLSSSLDEEFVKRLFGDLNCGLLGSLGDDKIIIVSMSNEKEEKVREENITNAKAATSSIVKSLATTTFTADVDDDDKGRSLDQAICDSNSEGNKVGSP
jgi:hypothetical protein